MKNTIPYFIYDFFDVILIQLVWYMAKHD